MTAFPKYTVLAIATLLSLSSAHVAPYEHEHPHDEHEHGHGHGHGHGHEHEHEHTHHPAMEKALRGKSHALNKIHSHPLYSHIQAAHENNPHDEKKPNHPLYHAMAKTAHAMKETAQALQETMEAAHEVIQAKREDVKARWASYEEGVTNSEFHFSIHCAKKTLDGAEACTAPPPHPPHPDPPHPHPPHPDPPHPDPPHPHPHPHGECAWCTVADLFGFCTDASDEDILSQLGVTCGNPAPEPPAEVENNFSVKCVKQTSSSACALETDEDNQPCNWCSYNSWIGVCISPDDRESAENDLFLTCGETSIL